MIVYKYDNCMPLFLMVIALRSFQLIILTLQMTSKTVGEIKIILPTLRNHSQPLMPSYEERDIHQQEKIVVEPKVFLAPKYESRPLALQLPKIQNLSYSTVKFSPTFQNFDLPYLFSNKLLNEKQAAEFSNQNLESNLNYQTPVRQSNNDPSWSSFKPLDNHIYCTAQSNKSYRPSLPELKKSRPKEKGLRKLSQRAYEIVLKMRSASYKQVANKLVDQLNSQQELDQQGKDQQNIKRRVYDALNVLIALGVLRKQGRKIVGDRQSLISFDEEKANNIASQVQRKKLNIQNKKIKLKQLQQKLKIYRQMTSTNIQHKQPKNIIKFPFLTLINEKAPQLNVQNLQSGQCNQLSVVLSQSENNPRYLDIDLLVSYKVKLESKIKS